MVSCQEVLHKQKVSVDFQGTPTAIYIYTRYRYVKSHGNYRHAFHDWLSRVVSQQLTHFTLPQLTSVSGRHNIGMSILSSTQPFMLDLFLIVAVPLPITYVALRCGS